MICHDLAELFEEFDVDNIGELSEILEFEMGVIMQEEGIALGIAFIDEDGTYAIGRLFPFDPNELWDMVEDLRAADESPYGSATAEGVGFSIDAPWPDLDELGTITLGLNALGVGILPVDFGVVDDNAQ